MSEPEIIILDNLSDVARLLYNHQKRIETILLRVEGTLMALSEAQTQAFDEVERELGELNNDITATFNAVTTGQQALRTRITELEALLAELQADDTADADRIETLTNIINDMKQQAVDSDTEVVARLRSLANSVDTTSTNVKGLTTS